MVEHFLFFNQWKSGKALLAHILDLVILPNLMCNVLTLTFHQPNIFTQAEPKILQESKANDVGKTVISFLREQICQMKNDSYA